MEPKMQYARAAAPYAAASSTLQFPMWCAGVDSNHRCPMGGRFTVSWNSRYPTDAYLWNYQRVQQLALVRKKPVV